MYFQIDPPGSDFTRVHLDVPNGQLEEIIRAVTTSQPATVTGEAQHTKIEALLEEAVELLKSVALSVMPPVYRFSGNARASGRMGPEDLTRGVWAIPADDMRVSFAGTTLADEDACRRVDDVDQDGPDCEGPEGGESA
ncbi:hypothetical protein HMPREF0569_1574 [Micrococcus luteus SK58]|uniref:hypothetical protein n=1 Tax=Micrococcus luteus TaxID=1270 RepID=UPI0001C4FFD4|nr:hypothetical protein [Micrococcus luteus]EFD50321.1 hypothetical protein HMPREF0569_1574 [Micrococcus luteus SK58]